MPYYRSFVLYQPPTGREAAAALPALPPGISARLEGAGLVLNHGLLVGDLLGIETQSVVRLLEEIDRTAEELPHTVLIREDIGELYATFSQISAALRAAIDEQGRPTGPGGDRLARSALVAVNADGALCLRSRHLNVLELHERLGELCRFLQAAIDNELLIEIN